MSESYLQLAEDFHRLGNVKAECKATELALRYDPQDFLCNVLHGQSLMRSDRYKEGLKHFEYRLQLSPHNGVYQKICVDGCFPHLDMF